VIEYLPSTHKALGLTPSTETKGQEQELVRIEKLELSYTVGRNVRWSSSFENRLEVPQKVKLVTM
jgi:hypothetical protein